MLPAPVPGVTSIPGGVTTRRLRAVELRGDCQAMIYRLNRLAAKKAMSPGSTQKWRLVKKGQRA